VVWDKAVLTGTNALNVNGLGMAEKLKGHQRVWPVIGATKCNIIPL